jgi:hypothetical protein
MHIAIFLQMMITCLFLSISEHKCISLNKHCPYIQNAIYLLTQARDTRAQQHSAPREVQPYTETRPLPYVPYL